MAETKDIEINQFPIVDTLSNKDYVVVSLDNGSQGRIKTSDLASVVAGIITYPFQYKGSVSQASDANNLTSSGWYRGSSGVANLEDWFHLIVFNFGSGYIFQIAKHNSNNGILIRTRNESGVWSAWNRLSLS